MSKNRCQWPANNNLMIKYHDEEWGAPLHDDNLLFEFLTLEGAQAGLSWQTVLNKRENYHQAFDGFNIEKISNYNQEDIEKLLTNSGIIRNRLKISSVINNAKAFLKTQKEFGSFDRYIWQFVNGKAINNKNQDRKNIPAVTEQSKAMSKDLLKRGFKFVGPTICYAFMQATGMVNDHEIDCFRYKEVIKLQ